MTIKIPSTRLIIAGAIAVVADVVQWLLIPAFSELGFMSPANDILDMAIAGIMVSLLGFHWVFVPSAVGKMVPGVDMMPFWSGAVFFVAMGQQNLPTGQPGQSGEAAEPIFPNVNPTPLTPPLPVLPAGTPETQTKDAQTAASLQPFFREINSK